MPKPMRPLLERFEEKVHRTANCWLWAGQIDKVTGYGKIPDKRADGQWRVRLAHRVAYELYRGPIASGLQIDHLCRNRACVNPDHLDVVTQRVNILRGASSAAVAAARSTCVHGHHYTPDTLIVTKSGARLCRICQAASGERRRRRLGKPLGNKFKTHCVRGHEFTPENTYINKYGRRRCRACKRVATIEPKDPDAIEAPPLTEEIVG